MFKKNFQSQNNAQKKTQAGKSDAAKKPSSAGIMKNSDSSQEVKQKKFMQSALALHNEDNKLYQVDFKVLEQLINARINANSTTPGGAESQKPDLLLQSTQSEKQFIKNSSYNIQQTMREKHRNEPQLNLQSETSLERSRNPQSTSLVKSKSIYLTQQSHSSLSDTEFKDNSHRLGSKKTTEPTLKSQKSLADQEKRAGGQPEKDQRRGSMNLNSGNDAPTLKNCFRNSLHHNEYGFNHPVSPKASTQTPQNQKSKIKLQAEIKNISNQPGANERRSIDSKKYLDNLIASNTFKTSPKGNVPVPLERKKSLPVNAMLVSPLRDSLYKPIFCEPRKKNIDPVATGSSKRPESAEILSKKKDSQTLQVKTPKAQRNPRPFIFEETQQQRPKTTTAAGAKLNNFFSNNRYLTNQSNLNTTENQKDNSQSDYSRSSINNSHQRTEYPSSQVESASLTLSKHKSFDNKLTNSLDQGIVNGSPFFNPFPHKKHSVTSGPRDFGFQLDLSLLGNSNSNTSSKNNSQLTKPVLGSTNEEIIGVSNNTTMKATDQESSNTSKNTNNQEKKLSAKEKLHSAQSKELNKKSEAEKVLETQTKLENDENIKDELQDLKGKVNKMQESITRFQESFSKIMGVQEEVNKKLMTLMAEDSSSRSRGTEKKVGSELETIRDYCTDGGSEMISSRTPESQYLSHSDRNRKSSIGGTSSRGNLGAKNNHRGPKRDGFDIEINRLIGFGEASKRSSNKDLLMEQQPSSDRDLQSLTDRAQY